MKLKNIKVVKNGRNRFEKFVVTKDISPYGWQVLETAANIFYEHSATPNMLQVEKFIRHCNFKQYKELVLDQSTLLHFSTGFTNVKTVRNILSSGLKCYEANISKFGNHMKVKDESNYVVDTWSFNSLIKYSDFAKDSPKFNGVFDFDRSDLEKSYAPAYSIFQLNDCYIDDIKNGLIFNFEGLNEKDKKEIECRALQNIGFIVNSNMMTNDFKMLDIYSNKTMQKEFCGRSFLSTSNMKGCYTLYTKNNGKLMPVGNYGVSSFLYGIPGEYIVGVVATLGMLYSNEICKDLFFSGLSNRFIISPIGTLLYKPNSKLTIDENFEEFVRCKDEYLARQDKEYRNFIVTKDAIPYQVSPWRDVSSSALSNRYIYKSEEMKNDYKTTKTSEQNLVNCNYEVESNDSATKDDSTSSTTQIDNMNM